jgi:hypothetical protein
MHTTVSRHAAHLTVAVLLILLVGGCTGQDANQAATPQPAMTTAAPTTAAPTPTTVPPLTAKELAWLKALPKLDAKVAKALKGAWTSRSRRCARLQTPIVAARASCSARAASSVMVADLGRSGGPRRRSGSPLPQPKAAARASGWLCATHCLVPMGRKP